MVFVLLVRFAEAQREPIHVHRFLAIDAARLDRLRQELVDAIRRLMVDTRMAFFERSFEFLRHLVLAVVVRGWLVGGWWFCVCNSFVGCIAKMGFETEK